jgi:hypothetical protein
MPKYEIEIPDGVLPEGTVPVAYRKPRPEDHYLSSVNSQHVCHAPKGKFCEKEAFLIVEKRPEPKFKVGDKVLVGGGTKTHATIHSVGSTARGPYYCLQYPNGTIGVLKWYENELKPYTEPQKPAQYQIGQIVSYRFDTVPDEKWVIRDCTRTPLSEHPVYKISPKDKKYPCVFVDERDLSPYVEKPKPKFKVGDWVNVDLGGFHQVERVWWSDISDTWWYDLSDNWQSNGTGTRLATRVPLTQDDAVKLALGEITPKDIQLEDKRFKTSLADRTVSTLGKREAGITLWLRIPGQYDTSSGYPISDLTRLV